MKKLAVLILFIACATGARTEAQIAAEPTKASRAAPEKKAKKTATDKKTESPATKLFGQDGSNAPTTTEIYADEAFFDSTKNKGIFSGRLKKNTPPSNIYSLTLPFALP